MKIGGNNLCFHNHVWDHKIKQNTEKVIRLFSNVGRASLCSEFIKTLNILEEPFRSVLIMEFCIT
jgi:hypothetical protein